MKLRISDKKRFVLLMLLKNMTVSGLYVYQLQNVLDLIKKLGPVPVVTPAGKKVTYKTIEITTEEGDTLVVAARYSRLKDEFIEYHQTLWRFIKNLERRLGKETLMEAAWRYAEQPPGGKEAT